MLGTGAFATAKEIILFILAIYAALLSTWNLVQALRKDRRAVRVTAGSKVPISSDGDWGATWAHLEAVNIGQRPVTVSLLSFEVAPGKRIFGLDDDPANILPLQVAR
jgi:hypothetical protein